MKLQITKITAMAISMLAVTVSGVPALAMGATANPHVSAATQTTSAQSTDSTSQPSTNMPAEPGSRGATRLAEAKLKACQKREKAVNNIMSRLSDRGQKQLDLFSNIATKTVTFYTEKGKTVPTYSTLVADVAAKKVAAQAAVDAVKADSVTFKCDGTDPKGVVSTFKTSLKTEITALKDYKTAVKNLIVGVKSVQGTTTSSDNKATGGNQ